MAKYFYKAVSFKGESVSGEEQAQDEKELARLLHARGFILTYARGEKQRVLFPLLRFPDSLFGVSVVEKLMFIRNLKVMVSAGVALPNALEVLSEQASNRTFSLVLEDIKERVTKGETLSGALEVHGAIFPEFFVSMVKVGEESGTLELVLSRLALQLEKQHDLRSKIFGALLYPAVVITAMIGVGILMLLVVVPQLAETFRELQAELPLTTRFIIGLGDFFRSSWYLVLAGVVGFGILLGKLLQTAMGKRVLDSLMLRLPIFGGMTRKANAALTVRTLSSLVSAGVPIVRSLEITSRVLGNLYYRKVLEESGEAVKEGKKLSEVIRAHRRLYPAVVAQMMEVGEETGKSSEVLEKLAEFFEDEITQTTKNLTSIMEPLLMIIIGIVVGFFAISMLRPMYGLLDALQQAP